MSADRLREAARVLRERADRAYGEPWRADPPNAVVWTGNDDEFPTVYVNGGLYANQGRTAAYIATMHPGVGLALADWLDVVSGWLDEGLGLIPPYSNIGDAWADIERQAYSLADIILRSDQLMEANGGQATPHPLG